MARIQLKFKESRMSERHVLTGLLPGKLFLQNIETTCRPTDISQHGLGVLISQKFSEGSTGVLDIGTELIPLKIQWARPDFGKHDLWRYGLVCTDPSQNLIEIFRATGCLKNT